MNVLTLLSVNPFAPVIPLEAPNGKPDKRGCAVGIRSVAVPVVTIEDDD